MRASFLVLLLAAGCSDSETSPEDGRPLAVEQELRTIRDQLYLARTLRVRFAGEWPRAVALMPKSATGTVLLGKGDRAKVSLTIHYAPGNSVTHEAVCDGTKLWRSPSVEKAKFAPEPGGLRREILKALAWYGVGWSFPQGPKPTTIGQGYVVCDLIPQERDTSASWMQRREDGLRTFNHEATGVAYRLRLTVDPATRRIRKRELVGEGGIIWYSENYIEIEINPSIPDEEFTLPAK